MKIHVHEVINKHFEDRSSSYRYNLALKFYEQYPEVVLLVEGEKRPKRYVTSQTDLDILNGYLVAQGGTGKSLSRTVTSSTLQSPMQGKQLVASMVRDVRQLRTLGYEISISLREPAKEI